MSKICNLWHLTVVDYDYAESYGRFLSGGNADASHVVYIALQGTRQESLPQVKGDGHQGFGCDSDFEI